MSDDREIKKPLDHLPPRDERPDGDQESEQLEYPDTGGGHGGSAVSPATAAEPDEPRRHGVDKLPPTGR